LEVLVIERWFYGDQISQNLYCTYPNEQIHSTINDVSAGLRGKIFEKGILI
jgi:hypothetical protein